MAARTRPLAPCGRELAIAVAAMLLSHAADEGVDLSGYGHSRLREFVLGGVTRSMLRTMTVPVLMSH
jgi:nucleotide-binding universal stress UspA family protein